MKKEEQRTYYKKIRKSLDNKIGRSNNIVNKILQSNRYIDSSCIGLYSPLGDEVNINQLIKQALFDNKKVCLPRVISETEMIFVQIHNLEDLSFKSKFGVLEPISDNVVDIKNIDLMVIPGIAFDSRGYRIGYGKGYYDRYLKFASSIYKMGVCFKECFMTEFIDNDEYDEACDIVITD